MSAALLQLLPTSTTSQRLVYRPRDRGSRAHTATITTPNTTRPCHVGTPQQGQGEPGHPEHQGLKPLRVSYRPAAPDSVQATVPR
jgi:hypothetical protein